MATPAAVSSDLLAKYEPVIGLEVHVQLLTASKIFCSCSTRFGDPPNTNVCPVCLGMPGALPVLNKKAVEFAALAAMALECRINEVSIFARKNYFYPDLPKGYQISQYDKPLAEFGSIEIDVNGGQKIIGITRLHLEEDAGKSLHEGFADAAHKTAIDLNRTGVPLAEIVSEPDMRSPEEAYEYLTRLKEIILYTGVSDCNMEEGSLRCDANISIRPRGQKELGTKTEVKNVNSFRFIKQALEYEIERHIGIIEGGGRITQETRLYNAHEGKTHGMRSKEQAHDYRYFPEPDLLPLVVDEKWQAAIRAGLPELPEARRQRMMKEYGITAGDAHTLTLTRAMADQFESAARTAKNPKRVANLVQGELLGRLKAQGLELERSPISMAGVTASADLVESGAISGKMLKDLYDLCFERGKDFPAVYEAEGRPEQSRDTSALEKLADELIAANPKQVEQYRAGKKTMIGFFVGQVMKASKGQANPQLVNEVMTKKLEVPTQKPGLYVPPSLRPGVEPVFANREFWPTFRGEFPKLLQVLPNLEDALSSVIDRAYESPSRQQRVVMHLVTYAGISMQEVVMLAANGSGQGAMKIVRNMLEATINAEYIRRHPDEAESFTDWAWVEQHKEIEYFRVSRPMTYAQIDAETIAKSNAEFDRVRHRFEHLAPDGTTTTQRSWCSLGVADRAAKSDLTDLYEMIYPVASKILHGTIGGLASQFELDKDQHRMFSRPTSKWCAPALVGAHRCLLTCMDTLCNVFEVEPTPARDQLLGDYHYAWVEPEKYYSV